MAGNADMPMWGLVASAFIAAVTIQCFFDFIVWRVMAAASAGMRGLFTQPRRAVTRYILKPALSIA